MRVGRRVGERRGDQYRGGSKDLYGGEDPRIYMGGRIQGSIWGHLHLTTLRGRLWLDGHLLPW